MADDVVERLLQASAGSREVCWQQMRMRLAAELQTCMWAAVELGIDGIGDVYGKDMAADAASAVDAAEVQEVTWLTM